MKQILSGNRDCELDVKQCIVVIQRSHHAAKHKCQPRSQAGWFCLRHFSYHRGLPKNILDNRCKLKVDKGGFVA